MERPGHEWFEPRWQQYDEFAQRVRADGIALAGGLSRAPRNRSALRALGGELLANIHERAHAVPPPQAPDRFNMIQNQLQDFTHPNQTIFFNRQDGAPAMHLRVTYLPLSDVLVDERISPMTRTDTGRYYGGTDLHLTRSHDFALYTLKIRAFPEPDSSGDVTVMVRMTNGKKRAMEELYRRRIRPHEAMSHDLPELGLRVEVWPVLG